jgi:hypothetical protein
MGLEATAVAASKAEEVESDAEAAEESLRPGRLPGWFTARRAEELAAKVIDVPMRWGPGLVAPVDEELLGERCSYVRAGDRKCGARALEDGMCMVHARWSRWAESQWPMTCPEDRESVQEALRQTLSWMIAGHITEKQALVIVAICRAILRTV